MDLIWNSEAPRAARVVSMTGPPLPLQTVCPKLNFPSLRKGFRIYILAKYDPPYRLQHKGSVTGV